MKKLSLTLAKTLIFFIIWAILVSVLPIPQTTNDAIWRFWAEVMPFVAIVGLTGVFWLMERRKLPLYLTSHPIKKYPLWNRARKCLDRRRHCLINGDR